MQCAASVNIIQRCNMNKHLYAYNLIQNGFSFQVRFYLPFLVWPALQRSSATAYNCSTLHLQWLQRMHWLGCKSAVCRSVNTVNTRRRTYIMGTWEGNIINIINSLQSICTCIYTKSLYRGRICFVLWPSFSPLLIFILRSFCCYRGCASRVIIASQYYPC